MKYSVKVLLLSENIIFKGGFIGIDIGEFWLFQWRIQNLIFFF